MSAPTTLPGKDDSVRAKTLRGLLLARELDGARVARGFTTRALASAMSMSPAMLNRVMTGRRVPTALEIGGLCAVLDVPANRRPVLYAWAETTDLAEWVLHPGVERNPVRDAELIADSITWFSPTVIPRPLRTAEYDAAIQQAVHQGVYHGVRHGSGTPQTGLRISRFLLHPLALSHPSIPENTMRAQLRHLLDAHPRAVRLLPADVVPQPGFRVLEIDHFPPVVHIEHLGTDLLLENPAATAGHTAFLQHLNAVALDTTSTRAALLSMLD